ncbi:hypothetical protein FEZ41_03285 [Lentilactobacillus parafarraginis]|uniref:Bacterial Ig domain-containing protein n=3 Tax=Lentilactobacillus parafarraginis TaxID=390842 RepID=A0A0R1YJE9_9LACO|nr:hypothetical protein [Lentilactobacillus parafarraginis]KRM42381.1 hypothetical protein FD47_GL001909 [Lentilactobacillus parafarraginis DSM 18390 = JCM 14109]TLQ20415.1 hypothetical protein FEZ41_03285 [Lentilactobacillus parafarraginis]
MKRFAMISGLVLVASLGMASSAQARSTKQAKASLYHFTEAAHYITGKATPGATVKVSRQKFVYAVGKARHNGRLRLKLRDQLSAKWHYTVTVTKRGLRPQKFVLGATIGSLPPIKAQEPTPKPADTPNPQIDQLNNQIRDLQNQIASTKGTQPATPQAPAGQYSQATMDQWFGYQRQMDDIENQMNQIGEQQEALENDTRLSDDLDFLSDHTESELRANIKKYSDELDSLEARKDADGYDQGHNYNTLSQIKFAQEDLNAARNDLSRFHQITRDYDKIKSEMAARKAQFQDFDNRLATLAAQKDALSKSQTQLLAK